MAANKILLVDDDEVIRHTLGELLTEKGFDVSIAGGVSEALKLISEQRYDVLLSDLHMPGAGDGLTVVSAMRHANGQAVTILLSSFPEMEAAARAILSQTDDILIKPMEISALVDAIRKRQSDGPSVCAQVESVATILARSAPECIESWYQQVLSDDKLMAVVLTKERRCSHLPQVFRDIVARLFANQPLGTQGAISAAAADHGSTRQKEGYSASMLVEESRILQVCIFHTLQKNLANIDFSVLLYQVMTIADEVDSQLRQAVDCYVNELAIEAVPALLPPRP